MKVACGGNTTTRHLRSAAENARWPLNKKQTGGWKLPVIVFTYGFRGRTPGLAVAGAISCWGSRPRPCLAPSGTDRASDLCTCGSRKEASGLPRDRATMESFLTLKGLGEGKGSAVCSGEIGVPQKNKEPEEASPLPPRSPRPTLLIFFVMGFFYRR